MDIEDRTKSFDVPGQLDVHLSTDEGDEGDPSQETFSDDNPALPPGFEWLEELYEQDEGDCNDDDDDDSDPPVVTHSGMKKSFAMTAQMFKLRRHLDQLDCIHKRKEQDVLKARQELNLCRQNIESLLKQRDDLEKEIERQKAAENSVMVFRLRAQHKHLCQKLQSDEELEGHINTELRQQELELTELKLELNRCSSVRQEVQKEEQFLRHNKIQKIATRLQEERKASQNLQLKMDHLRDTQEKLLMEDEFEGQKKIEVDQVNRKIAAMYLKETTQRMHQQEAEKEQQNRDLLEKRIQAVESLKSNIAVTRENLQVKQRQAKALAQRKKQEERQLKESLQAQGINSVRHMYQQKQLDEMKRKEEEFAERQKSKRVEIVAKILQEEELERSRRDRKVLLSKPLNTSRFPALVQAREDLLCYRDPSPPSAIENIPTIQLREFSDISSSSSISSDVEDLEEAVDHEDHQSSTENLAEPEFSGLWDQDGKLQMSLSKDTTLTQTDIKQEVPAGDIGKLKTPVKVHGKNLKGPPFISKPEVIHFKDFEVGKTYKKKVILTNISYIINYCKLLGVSTHLKEVLSVNFVPPGSLSPGMSCDMQAVFQPGINEEMEGEIQFVSAAGPFSVPFRCSIKKCDLEVDSQFIDFGSHVVGQTISRTFTLTNRGALATFFSMDTSACLSPDTGHARLPFHVSANANQEISSQSIISDEQRSTFSTSSQELQPQQACQDVTEVSQEEQAEASATCPKSTSDVHVMDQVDQCSSDFSDIHLGNVREGEIGPFKSIKLDVIFTPTVVGEVKLNFHIKFSDVTSKPIPIHVRGLAVSVPVFVVRPSIDLKICMFDFLYQDTITVQSSASIALKLIFEVCPELRKHVEILPKMGFIQPQSTFNAQLKFLPRCSLSKDAETFFDSDTGVLEVPMAVQVSGQVKPFDFVLHAIVTSTDLQFDRTEVDFGFCSVYQSVRISVRLSNLSLLPQEFGFVDVPEFLEVQPNDGFGTVLPQETLQMDLIFSANKAKEYNFQLCCKSGINRDFLLSCRAVGVRPPLELSHSLVQFGATALGDCSTAILHLINHETNQNQSKQPTSTLDKDTTAPVGPRLFSFIPPEKSDVSITPSAGSLLPGERCLIQVTFRPRLSNQVIEEEALRLFHCSKLLREQELERNRLTEQETNSAVPAEPSKKRKGSVIPKNSKISDSPKMEQPTESPDPADEQPGSEHYEQLRSSLLYSFTRRYREFTVPCFVSDGEPPQVDRQLQPAWRPWNTLHLKLQCPVVQPPLVVISGNGQSVLDFGQVAVGESMIKRMTLQNISKEALDLSSSLLDPLGTFSLLNTLRCLKPGEKQSLVLDFSPSGQKKYCETLEVRSQMMTLEVALLGEGVVPVVTLSPPGDVLDFGYVLEKESTSQVLQLKNSSAMEVTFRVEMESLSPSRPHDGSDEVSILLGNYTDPKLHPVVGTQNYSGLSVFSALPAEGSIDPGQSQDITVTFQPDHASVNYFDRLTIELTNKRRVCVMDLAGAASSNNMYLYGGDRLAVPIDSLLPPQITSQAQLSAEPQEMEKASIPVLVTLKAICSGGAITPAVRELQVGCIRSTSSSKKNGEFVCEDVESLQPQGFSVEPTKGSVEPDQRRTITVTWTPPTGYKPNEVVQTCVPVTLKGEETDIYRVTLMALVSNTAD
ncbi:cilia- and flagella-associated protein 74 [Antennarius striatus]|uniref:cilia- and flagella-associated protein 74 n=1 Tax=Antennarius striatus TaxID=241820 RepID=UPI0035AE681C